MENITEEIITTETVVSEDLKEEAKEQMSTKSEMELAFDNIRPDKNLNVGQVVTAIITSANDNGLTLSIKNSKRDDLSLPKEEIMGEYSKEAYQEKVGEKIRVMVIAKQPIVFSEKALEGILKEEAEIEEIKNGKIFEAVIKSTNKGGLIGEYGRYSVFVPASQIKLGFVKDLEKYVGKTLRLKAEKVESKGARRQIVGSQKVIIEAEKAAQDAIKAQKEAEFFGSIQEGDVVLGTPVRFAAFGAFIDVNGFDCLAHISDLSWTGCKDCAEVLELGKQYEFKILKIDIETKRVSIGYKQLQPRPWDNITERYNVGDVVKGKVVRIVNFGAFVEVEKGIDGLVHVSQISNQWLENPVTALEIGQEIEAKFLGIDVEKEKMTLSIKALLPEEPKPEVDESKKAKKGKVKVEEDDEDADLREWKDDSLGGASIAEMLGNNEN
jgi:4-hydroxy-3-methylbut-2-enyl diphosphate reductase